MLGENGTKRTHKSYDVTQTYSHFFRCFLCQMKIIEKIDFSSYFLGSGNDANWGWVYSIGIFIASTEDFATNRWVINERETRGSHLDDFNANFMGHPRRNIRQKTFFYQICHEKSLENLTKEPEKLFSLPF